MLEIYDLSEHLFNLFETILLASQKVLITAPRSMENFDEIAGNGYPLNGNRLFCFLDSFVKFIGRSPQCTL